jgi:hypothetical protein
MRLLERYLLAGFDPAQLTGLQLHRLRSITGTILGLSFIALFFLGHSLWLGLPLQAATLLVAFGVGVSGYALMARTGRIAFAGHAVSAALMLVLVGQAFGTGGFGNPQFAWFLVVPLIAGWSMGLREGVSGEWGARSPSCCSGRSTSLGFSSRTPCLERSGPTRRASRSWARCWRR